MKGSHFEETGTGSGPTLSVTGAIGRLASSSEEYAMTKQGAKTTLLFVGTATVVVLSIYVTYKQRRLSEAAVRATPPSTPEPARSEGVAG